MARKATKTTQRKRTAKPKKAATAGKKAPARRKPAAKPRAATKKTPSPKRKKTDKSKVKTPAQLREYERKRDLKKTPEPAGKEKVAAADGAPRFVIQEHHATRLHWDLRLEHDGVLLSWAIPNGLPQDPKDNRKAIRTEDHPLEYLDFHGEIPKGQYGAGTMEIWDRGTFDAEKMEAEKVIANLHGERLDGRYALFRAGKDEQEWMIHRMDPPSDPGREPMPERLVPMLACLDELPKRDDGWAYEIKWDGVRAIAYAKPGRLRLESRNLNDITAQYPELRALTAALGAHEAVLDGEIVAYDDDGIPSFERLQQRMHHASESTIRRRMKSHPVTYVAFDVLYLDGHSLMELPYSERRDRLAALRLERNHVQVPAHREGGGKELRAATRERGLEGIVAKRLDSPYEPGKRSRAWIKVKNTARQEFVVGGWLPGEGRRRERIGALLAGTSEDGGLRYRGRVGTGFKEADLDRLAARLAELERDQSPFTAGQAPPRGAIFVEPELVAEVEFREVTKEGLLRAPSYKGLRDDKEATEVNAESVTPKAKPAKGGKVEVEVDGRTLRLSNLDKVLYPTTGFTKGQLIDYYARIAPMLLPHLHDRPLTLKRYPDGIEADFFYEKNAPSHRPEWVQTAPGPGTRGGKPINYVLANDLPTLVWLGNLADLELHPLLSLAGEQQRPTAMAFDLDPGEGADLIDCCEVGLLVRGMLSELGLSSYAKTSGSKGMQVYVPLNTDGVSFNDTKAFAKSVAETFEAQLPDRVISKQTKKLRTGRVLIDWSQNAESKTTVSVYSLRAKERPTVSTPLTWDEVEQALEARDPSLITFECDEVLERVEEHGDLFAPVLSEKQELPKSN